MSKTETKTEIIHENLARQNRFVSVCSALAVALCGTIFAVLSVSAFLYTCRIDRANIYSEIINFDSDSLLLNTALLIFTFMAALVFIHKHVRLGAVKVRYTVAVMLAVTTAVAVSWNLLVRSVPSGDSNTMVQTAIDAAADTYPSFFSSYSYYGNYSYYRFYPFQLGYVLFAEGLFRVFGGYDPYLVLQFANIVALDFLFVGLVLISNKLFSSRTVVNMTAIALTFCFQPMFITTFTYGILPGLALAVWSVYFTIRFMRENRWGFAVAAAVLIALSVVLKYNNMIMLAAISIALILHAIGRKRFFALLLAAVMVFASVGSQKLVIKSYAARAGVELNTEVTQILYAYLGMSESGMAPGWYNSNAMYTLRDAGMDVELAEEHAREGISARMEYFSDHPDQFFQFYGDKISSQWNEPLYESLWVSEVRGHNVDPLPGVVTSTYSGGLYQVLEFFLDWYQMIVFIGFSMGMFFIFISGRRGKGKGAGGFLLTPEVIIIPVAVIGGFLYHTIFEAKSQYVLSYYILLIPFAVFGLYRLSKAMYHRMNFMFK